MEDVYTFTIGRVMSFKDNPPTCNVQPLIKKRVLVETVELPVIRDVPCMPLIFNDVVLKPTYKKDDLVFMVFNKVSSSEQLDNQFSPSETNMFNLANGFILSRVLDNKYEYPDNVSNNKGLLITDKSKNTSVDINKDSIIFKVGSMTMTIDDNGLKLENGDVKADMISLKEHKHSYVPAIHPKPLPTDTGTPT